MLCPTIMNKISEAYRYKFFQSKLMQVGSNQFVGKIISTRMSLANCADCVSVYPGSPCV